MKWTPALLVLTVIGTASCAAMQLGGAPDAQTRLQQGIEALGRNDFAGAQDNLRSVYQDHWSEPEGREALLVLTTAEIDPRNPSRRLWASAELAASMIKLQDGPTWTKPVGETLYLLALELGAKEEQITRAEAERDAAAALPTLDSPSVVARIGAIRAERDSLKRKADQLEQLVAQRDKELKEKTQELERIKKIVKG
jgi:hypothetical protein